MTPLNSASTSQHVPLISERIKSKIVETVSLSKLSIIVGPTGSGKSTQIPPLLLDGLKGRILCSQPRRLAVVAIAKRVAEERGVLLGSNKVGYHVGNHNLSTKATELLFTTAGILLEELRNNGVEALTKFSCVIIDECHERSPESDLVLALVKNFMQSHPKERIRLVLMSATFDYKRYASYFKNVPGCSVVDTITLETAQSFQAWHTQVSTYYLDDLPHLMGDSKSHEDFIRSMRLNPDADLAHEGGKNLSFSLLSLIRTLVTQLDLEEPVQAPFLIFAPTYRHLEQLFDTLVYVNGGALQLSVLHSAVDIEDCIRTIASSGSGHRARRRRVLLASAIADSSVTVPGVSCVIDLCRALQVRWDVTTRSYTAKTVWCSKSIADQRRGRTGRTCAGRVFRLVHQGFYIQRLEQWDLPQLTMSACHNEVLAMVCADDKLQMDDPRGFFRQCLDPPDLDVVDDAIDYLSEIGACHEVTDDFGWLSSDGAVKITPTDYGSLMAALPLSVAEARVVLEGGRVGLLHETLALMAIYNHKPSPVVHHFGEIEKNQDILESFYPNVQANSTASVALANLSAYLFWDIHWNRDHNHRCMNASRLEYSEPWKWNQATDEEHIKWCKKHDVNPTSMRSVTDIIENSMNVLYLAVNEPEWLRCTNPTPRWKRSEDWAYSIGESGRDMLSIIYGEHDASVLCEALTKLCINRTATSALQSARAFLGHSPKYLSREKQKSKTPMACIHFLMGKCKYGKNCRHSHSRHARRPPCRFFLSGNCAKGDKCVYSHEDTETEGSCESEEYGPSEALVPTLESLTLRGGEVGWFTANACQLFLLGEGNFQFTRSLIAMGSPPFLTSTDVPSPCGALPRALIGIDSTQLHLNQPVSLLVRDEDVKCFAWNFPFTGAEEDALAHEQLILRTLESLVFLFDECRPNMTVTFGLTLQGDQFSRWNVTRSLWRTGWQLVAWSEFDHEQFPGYTPCRQNGESFSVDKARLYILERRMRRAGYAY